MTWDELRDAVAQVAAGLRSLGVERGDRVVAYLPNIPEALIAFLATASIGAIWSSCSPDFGAGSVVDRFAQIEPKVLFAVDGYRYNGRDFDRLDVVAGLEAEMPTLERTVVLPYLDSAPDLGRLAKGMSWDDLLAAGEGAELEFERVPFDHPLWVLYSSGTTGLPKAIVQGHGGILLEQLKKLNLHVDLQRGRPALLVHHHRLDDVELPRRRTAHQGGDRALRRKPRASRHGRAVGARGAHRRHLLRRQRELRRGVHERGRRARRPAATSAPCARWARPARRSPPRASTGSTSTSASDTWLFSTSGGTDVCTAFVGGVPTLPVYRGELQARALGAAVEAFDEDGNAVVDEVGELVLTEPMPSMPLFLWGDDDGSRYHESYFDHYPGVWRHGDWIEITSRGTAVIYGRSDSTINRQGVRMGTSEIYRAVQAVPQVIDALVVDVPKPGTEGWMPLFVVLDEGVELDDELSAEIKRRIREQCSPRHVPNEIFQIDEVPRTLSGKVLEIPVKRILMGTPADEAASRDSLANPAALDYFTALAKSSS